MRTLLLILLSLVAVVSYAEENFPVPEGYVLQELDPTGGKIAKPKDWFYYSSGTPSGWLWTISADKATKDGFETGLRIQMLVGVAKGTKQSTESFAKKFLQKKIGSAKVINECPATDQGDFTRQCLEVIESIQRPEGPKEFRVLYSVFWGNKLDMVVVNTFGTPNEKWETFKSISEVMSNIQLIGPDFGKSK